MFRGVRNDERRSRKPTSVALAIALAADVEGATAVEANAREAIRRLEIWGCPQLTRVVWRLGGDPGGNKFRTLAHAAASMAAAAAASDEELAECAKWPPASLEGPRFPAAVAWDVQAARFWSLARRYRCVVPYEILATRKRALRKALAGRLFRSLPSPFDPLLAIWQQGYALGTLEPDAIVLIAPELEQPR